ncbi:DNA repair protein RecN [Myxococcaceae bacterium]|nr:DNA repair protein RecN [Myxococcaceae bacterium]
MIEWLRIENLAVVERAELAFGPGLNVLTGETGAGKSIVLGALALLAGGRASADAVRDGADEAVVEAVFRTGWLADLEAALAARGLDVVDHELVVRRTVSRSGRSRAQIAGHLVPVALLTELFGGRIEISSQHESQALLRPDTHALLLDAYALALDSRARVSKAFSALRAIDDEIAGLRHSEGERARRLDFLSFQVREIDEAKLAVGERARLAAERSRLGYADRLRTETASATRLLSGETSADDPGALARVGEAMRRIDAASRLDEGLASLAGRLRATLDELEDVARDIERYGSAIEADPGRLAEVEDRLALLERLGRKYGASEEAVLEFRARAAVELDALEGGAERISGLEAERERAAAALTEAAAELSRARSTGARALTKDLATALGPLVEGAVLSVSLEPVDPPAGAPCGPAGREAVELRFAGGPGETPRPLRRVASGGELSRVFLACKNVLRRAEPGMVLVFDEVDAGIGGRIADRVGRTLADLSQAHQVLCITHLPQIAARASTHFRVEKSIRVGRTVTEVARLDERARVEEIARMAGGETVSDATRRHARALLGRGPGAR